MVGLEKEELPTMDAEAEEVNDTSVSEDGQIEDVVDLDEVDQDFMEPDSTDLDSQDVQDLDGERDSAESGCRRGLDCELGYYCQESSATCQPLSICAKAVADGYGQTYQAATEDLYDECTTEGCGNGYCKGDAYECGYYTSGQQNCGTCYSCEGATNVMCVAQTVYFSDATALGCIPGDVGCRYCSEGTCTFYTSDHHNCPTCMGCDASGFCNANLTSHWGSDDYGCMGSNARCVEGTCRTCSGWLYSDGCGGCAGQGIHACWYQAGLDENCTSACSSHGGCVAADWDDDDFCSVCIHFNSDSTCWSTEGTSHYYPMRHIYGSDHRCSARRSSVSQGCGAVWGVNNAYQKRQCVCEY